ncbi:MAG TPA: hypothetical protein VMR97_11425, partial [Acidimicrobiales bacterium]|nr:hypothetical protein [Acidimicrobiales bacterium]
MYKSKRMFLVIVVAMGIVAATSVSSAAKSDPKSNSTITVGVLTDLTGPGASGNKTTQMGVQAGV